MTVESSRPATIVDPSPEYAREMISPAGKYPVPEEGAAAVVHPYVVTVGDYNPGAITGYRNRRGID